MRSILVFTVIILLLNSCKQNKNPKSLDKTWLDSIISKSDSNYIKPYYRTDFVKAQYYVNSKDSTLTQVMKDSAGNTRQIIIMKGNTRYFYAQYYPNGHIQAALPLDEFGQYHGIGTFYFENGKVQSSGNYDHGLKKGQWKVYNEESKLITTDNFDNNGQLIQAHP